MLAGGSLNKGGPLDQGEELVPAAVSDTGCTRELNEDRYAMIESPAGTAWVVCDGMGGVQGGELAAQLAIDAMRRDLERAAHTSTEHALQSSLIEANRIIVLRRQNQAFAQMGTTVVAALIQDNEVVISHVGDSRAYLVRDGGIRQLTVDDTYVQQLVDLGKIKPEEALTHPDAHKLTRCVGYEPAMDVEGKRFWIWNKPEQSVGDKLFLCTDGLYSLVSDAEIATCVCNNAPHQACVKLVELAKSRGGYDNITIVIVPIDGELKTEPAPGGALKKNKPRKKKVSQLPEDATLSTGSTFKLLAMVLALAGLAAVLTFLVMSFYLKD